MAIFYATFFQEQFFPTKAMEKNGTEKMLRKKMATETISWRLAADKVHLDQDFLPSSLQCCSAAGGWQIFLAM